jgi:ribosomal protein L16/L10AE
MLLYLPVAILLASRAHIASLDEARTLIERTMNRVLGTGVQVFPRGAHRF